MKIAGATALVTGGNRGIGEAFVRAFLEAGAAKVYVGTRDAGERPPSRRRAFRVARSRWRSTSPIPSRSPEAARRCGDVSILVNNAGQFTMSTLIGADDMSAARSDMEVNYFAPLAMCRAFAPVLAKHAESAIANVLSAGGIVAVPGMGGYSPSKFAARAMTTCVRAELAGQNTTVTALIVGSVDTRMASHVQGFKEAPATIAAAGLKAIARGVEEVDTDFMAIDVRAHLARDPKGLELAMRRSLSAEPPRTGR